MKTSLSCLLAAMLASSQVACNASDQAGAATPMPTEAAVTPNVVQYAAKQGWTLAKSPVLAIPAAGVAAVVYTANGDFAPSCGLLAQTKAGSEFFEILRPEPGMGYPQCLTINDAAAFEWRNRRYLVIEYINRDTKEDFYRQYFYVHRDASGRYQADSGLNDSDVWTDPLRVSATKIKPGQADEGVRRAKGILLAKSVPGMRFLERDFVAGPASAFATFHDHTSARCAFVVEADGQPSTFTHDLFADGDKCKVVLASGKLEHAGTTYFLTLFQGEKRNYISVFSVSPAKLVKAQGGKAMAASAVSKLPDMKAAKDALRAIL